MLDLFKTKNLHENKKRNRDIDQVTAILKVINRPKYNELVFVAKKNDIDMLYLSSRYGETTSSVYY